MQVFSLVTNENCKLLDLLLNDHFLFLGLHLGSIIITSLQDIIKTEGLRGMYRGLSPTILALLPNWAVSIVFLIFNKQILEIPFYLIINFFIPLAFASFV